MRRPDRSGVFLLLAFWGTVAFFLAWYPWNYFGGETFVGNRYLLTLYPALLVALRRLPHPASLALVWCLASVSYGSALVSSVRSHDIDRSSQNHTYAGIFRLLPYESTAVHLTVGRDLYWSGHLVRFVDRFATPKTWSFQLQSGEQAAELMVAEWRAFETLRLEVMVDVPEATLHFSDYGHSEAFAVGSAHGKSQRVDLSLSPAWRRHLFWWNPQVNYNVRTLRLRLSTPDGRPARAQIRYLGDPALAVESAAYEFLGADVPAVAVTDETRAFSLRLRNTSSRIWETEDVMPVRVVATFRKGGSPLVYRRGKPQALPRRVFPGEEVEVIWDQPLPGSGGAYSVELDLIIEGEGAFAGWLGEPVFKQKMLLRWKHRS
jgi:hypothetical protein